MRLSTASILALPLLAAAQENPLDQVTNVFNKILSYIPSPNQPHTPEPIPEPGTRGLNILTLDNWDHTIRSVVGPASTKSEEWWILVTGGNKTCWGRCDEVEKAFNQTAKLWAANPDTPHLGYVNCDAQPVLCNAWGAGSPCMWYLDVPPPTVEGGRIAVRSKSLNTTTTTTETFVNDWENKEHLKLEPYEGYFHPFHGKLAEYGLAIPAGYLFWFLAVVPSWLFMIFISFASRTIMNRRAAAPNAGQRRAAPPPAAAARPAAGNARTRKNK